MAQGAISTKILVRVPLVRYDYVGNHNSYAY